jgi:hypothetical protein
MRQMRSVAVAVFLAITLVMADSASANWYAGNIRYSSYGVKAQIWTPASAPYLANSGESNWVSLPSPYWIQTGWRYYKGWSAARRYIEYNNALGYALNEYGTQAWSSVVDYKVNHIGGTTWCAYINDGNQYCVSGLASTPAPVLALSESHDSGNVLNTRFQGVYYRTSGGAWQVFDQSNWVEDSPYWVQKDNTYYFLTQGP